MTRLTETTKAFLDGICFASNFFWTDGGMSYEEISHNPKQVVGKSAVQEKIQSVRDAVFYDSNHSQLTKLTRFLSAALGHDSELASNYPPISSVAEHFLSRINLDLKARWFSTEIQEDDFGMDIQLLFADENGNAVCLLKMSWRVD